MSMKSLLHRVAPVLWAAAVGMAAVAQAGAAPATVRPELRTGPGGELDAGGQGGPVFAGVAMPRRLNRPHPEGAPFGRTGAGR